MLLHCFWIIFLDFFCVSHNFLYWMWGSVSTAGNWNERYSCLEIGQPFHQELHQSSVSLSWMWFLLLFSLPLRPTAFSSLQQWAVAERGPSLEMASCPALVYLVVGWCCSLLSASLGCMGPAMCMALLLQNQSWAGPVCLSFRCSSPAAPSVAAGCALVSVEGR